MFDFLARHGSQKCSVLFQRQLHFGLRRGSHIHHRRIRTLHLTDEELHFPDACRWRNCGQVPFRQGDLRREDNVSVRVVFARRYRCGSCRGTAPPYLKREFLRLQCPSLQLLVCRQGDVLPQAVEVRKHQRGRCHLQGAIHVVRDRHRHVLHRPVIGDVFVRHAPVRVCLRAGGQGLLRPVVQDLRTAVFIHGIRAVIVI